MKAKIVLQVLSLLLIIPFVLAACSNSDSTSNGSVEAEGSEGATDGASGGEKEEITIRIGAGAPVESSIWLQPIKEYFMPEVDKALESTNYKIKWIENWGTITNMPGELETIKTGLLDVGFSTAAFQPSHLLMSSMGFNTPFSSSDPDLIAKVANRMEETFDEFAGEYDKTNAKLLGLSVSENYVLVTNFPVESLDDLKGKKIAGASANQKWLEASGAIPVQSALTEAYQSLQSGVYEGWVIFPSSIIGFKLHEQAKYLTNVNFGSMILGGLVVNNDTWAKLPTEVQEVFAKVGKEYTDEIAKHSIEVTKSNLEKMKAEGVQVSTLDPAVEAEWASRLAHMPNDYVEELNKAGLPGKDIMEAYIQYQIEEGHTFPPDYKIN